MRVAAACWRDHCSPGQVAIDMAAELDAEDARFRRRVREASWDVSGAAPWTPSPSHAELQERRGPVPGDAE